MIRFINLAGDIKADETILEELYLANIPAVKVEKSNNEVPYSFIGEIGKWKFERTWRYWVVSVENIKDGLIFNEAMELHYKKHPIKDEILGKVIRCGGDAGCSSPDKNYNCKPLDNEDLNRKLEALGYNHLTIPYGELRKLCTEGILDVKTYVSVYHIDTQIGLNEFVKFIKGGGND